MRLQPLELWIRRSPGPLLPQIRRALEEATLQSGASARPLRWAITAADPLRGLRIEAVLIDDASQSSARQPVPRPEA